MEPPRATAAPVQPTVRVTNVRLPTPPPAAQNPDERLFDEEGSPEGCASGECLPDAPPVPIDGGLSLLALAGAGYAAKRLRARRA